MNIIDDDKECKE